MSLHCNFFMVSIIVKPECIDEAIIRSED
jgi:hypothetical protein